jgi:signal transduction histidine kinase
VSKKKEYDILANSLLPRLMPGIIHEINNPLGVILNNNETLKNYIQEIVNVLDERDEKKEKDIFIKKDFPLIFAEIDESAQKIASIMKGLQVLTIAQQEQKEESLNSIVDKVLDMCWNEFKYDFKLTKKYSDVSRRRINAKQTGLIVLLVFIDVIDVLKDHKEIEICTGQKPDRVFMTIEDNREKKKQGKHPLLEKINWRKKKEGEWIIEKNKDQQKVRLLTEKTRKGQKTTVEVFGK